jgi:hypothetical protein
LKNGGGREQIQRAIAALAARLIAEDDLDSTQARHKAAVEILGATVRANGALPDHEQIEGALREYLRLHMGESHRVLLKDLRELALAWMQALESFQPHLVGSVLNGSATEHSHLHLHLFTDSAKDVEMALLDRGLDIRVGPADNGPAHAQEVIGFLAPGATRPLSTGDRPNRLRDAMAAATPILLTVLDTDALRFSPSAHARRQDPSLHPIERSGRANVQMLRQLLAESAQPETPHA